MNWNAQSEIDEGFRKKVIWASAVIIALGLAGAIYYYKYYAVPPPPPKVEPARPAAPVQATEPEVRNPVPEDQAASKPLPALKESDPELHDSLVGLLGAPAVQQFLVPENIVRHVVVTVDNLPRKKVAAELRPVKPTPGTAEITTQGDITTLSAADYARYTPFIHLVQSVDAQNIASVYFRLYPLFQQAYEDLGYPGQYFNDRLVEVIDDALRAPDVQGPIQVTQPKVFYEFADPHLESLSAGQKLMLRIGPQNEAIVKAKLRELRKAVANREEQPVTH
ncbi:MAG: DUF3014 domain-containing protein [Sinobacteraceae bacterium]|nr:DUF3014 domain-containing protein [Nevskiaceae bacterium]